MKQSYLSFISITLIVYFSLSSLAFPSVAIDRDVSSAITLEGYSPSGLADRRANHGEKMFFFATLKQMTGATR